MNLQKIPTPRNTSVWMMFYMLSMAGLLAYWFVLIMEEMMSEPVRNAVSPGVNLFLNVYGIVVTIWCAVKLRGLPKDIAASVSETEPGP